MATNSGKNARIGAVSSRSQVFNPATGNYVKRDSKTGQFMDVKADGKPFKGVRKEATSIKANPSIDKATASKAEKAVIGVKNKRANEGKSAIKSKPKK
jgi:hypothetical protein